MQANEEEVSKSGRQPLLQQQRQEDEDTDNGDFHQVDNNGNLENGNLSSSLPIENDLAR